MLTGQAKKEYQKQWRTENKERIRKKMAKWNEDHKAEILEYRKNYRKSPNGKAKRKAYGIKYYAEMPLSSRKTRILSFAKRNAKEKCREFSITVDDLIWNTICPVLGIELNYGKPKSGRNSYDSPSVDRIDSSKGYIKGNVVIMSWRANRIKTDATVNELSKLISYLTKQEK